MAIQIFIFLTILSGITLAWTYAILRIIIVLFPVLSRYSTPIMIIGLL